MIENATLCGIYRITAPSGSCYVGMTTRSFQERWKGHRKELRNGKHKCAGLKRAYAKYGEAALRFEILEVMPEESIEAEILLRERDWWDKLHSAGIKLYNGRPTGTGSVQHTQETRKKISDSVVRVSKVSKQCPTCNNNFESFERLNRTYCSRSCSRSDPSKRKGLSTRVSKDILLKLKAQGKTKKDMAVIIGCSLQSVCDLHRYWNI